MTRTRTIRSATPWRFAMIAALTALALLGAACSGVLASGDDGAPEDGSRTTQPANPGGEPAPSDGDRDLGDDGSGVDLPADLDPDRPVSSEPGDGTPKPGGGSEPGAGSGGQPGVAPDHGERKSVQAPIDDLDLEVMESAPPQYRLRVVSGLPSGCAEYSHTDVERDGTTIRVTIWNTVPADDEVPCTMIYGMHDSAVDLGSDFESGLEYTVQVNDQSLAFTAQ